MNRYRGGHDLSALPILHDAIDTFYQHYGPERAYSFLQERPFRERLEAGTLPTYLILAVLACGVPVTSHPHYEGSRPKAAHSYSQAAWHQASSTQPPTIESVQTILLLSITDILHGRVQPACEKVSRLVQVSRDLHLLSDPPSYLSFTQQEERRRISWIIFIADKNLSAAKSRPVPEILDDECTLQLPCDEEIFRAGEWQGMPTVNDYQDLIAWNPLRDEELNGNSIVILIVAILGRCVTYVRRDGLLEKKPPWTEQSGFAGLNLLLHRVETCFGPEKRGLADVEMYRNGVATSQVDAGLALYSRINWHFCFCFMNHPYYVRQLAKPFECDPQTDVGAFVLDCLDTATVNARQMIDFVDMQYAAAGVPSEASSYPYWIVIVGSIHSLVYYMSLLKERAQGNAAEASKYFNRSLEILKILSNIWPQGVHMESNLRAFHALYSQSYAASLNATSKSGDIDGTAEQVLGDLLDHELASLPIPALSAGGANASPSSSRVEISRHSSSDSSGSSTVRGRH